MGRGIGERGQQLLARLEEADGWTPLHQLADDPGDPNEMNKTRVAVQRLERRGLVRTMRDADYERLIDTTMYTTVIVGSMTAGLSVAYTPQPTTRAWFGMWVRVGGPLKLDDLGELPDLM
jgi:hypothetical protein